MPKDSPITLAAITGAHGVTGEVRLKLFGDGVASLKAHKAFIIEGGSTAALTVKSLRDDGKGGAVARFAEVADRNGAEKLRGTLLTVPRDALPPLGEGEYYHADIIGLAAVTEAGEPLGTVIAIDNFGAGDVLEIERPGVDGKRGKRFMVPMRVQSVPQWDDTRLIVSALFVEDE